MARLSVQLGGSALVAVLIGSGLYWFVGDPGVAVVTGIIWGSALALGIHQYSVDPSTPADAAWERGRWIGVGTGLMIFAAVGGVSPTLPISTELRFGLGALIVGVYLVGVMTASLAELERFDR